VVRPPRRPAWYGPLWHPTAVRNGNKLLDLPGLRGSGMRPIGRIPVTAFGRKVQGIPLTGGQASTIISAGPSSGNATLVQAKSGTATSGTTVTVTLTNPTTAGNCLVISVGASQGTTNPTVSGVTLGGSATNVVNAKTANNNADVDCEVWVIWNIAGGQTSVVVTFNAGTGAGQQNVVWAEEYSGVLATSNPVDAATANGANGNSTSPSSGSTGTLSQPGELLIGAISAGAVITGPSSPWVNETNATVSTLSLIAGHQVTSATTAQTYSGTITSAVWGAVIVGLKLAPAGGGALPAGQGIVSVGPQGLGNVWYPAQATISTISGINDASTFSLYLGPAGVPVTLVGQLYPGGLGTLAVAVPSMTPGQYLIGVWTGGNPGDVASINVIGTMDCLSVG